MTDMIFLTDGDYHNGTKCPETKLEIKERKMTETDISKVLIEGDYATIQGVKYKRVEEPKPQTLLEIIREWNCDEDYLTDEELVNRIEKEWLPEPKQEAGDTEVYYKNKGWNNCIKKLKEMLR